MSLHSKVKQYDVLLKELFELLERTEESENGRVFCPVQIFCCREIDRIKLEQVLLSLKNTMKDTG